MIVMSHDLGEQTATTRLIDAHSKALERIAELEAALHPFTIPGPAGAKLFRPDGTKWVYIDLTVEVADIDRARKALGIID